MERMRHIEPHAALRAFLAGAVRFLLLMLVVSFVTFALVAASPIDPVQANVGQQALLGMSAAKRAALAAHWGADTPLLERYGQWLAGVLSGDWGLSLRFNAAVISVVAERFSSSCVLMGASWLLSGVAGVLLGVVAGMNAGGAADRVIRKVNFALASTPPFWVGMVALMVFAVWLGWLPAGFSAPIGVSAQAVTALDRARHLVLPVLTLSIVGLPGVVLHTREKTLDVLASDYVRFARARGESRSTILFRHGLRNLILPALTLQCASVGEVFGGSILVEQVFSYPGLGQAAVTAGLGGDAPLLVGIAMGSAAFVFAGNAVADLLRAAVDPRMGEVMGRDR